MTIFAGAFSRRPDRHVPAELTNELKSSISRHPDDTGNWQEYFDDSVYIIKIDIGVLGEPGRISNADITAFVAGDPILQSKAEVSPLSRAESLQVIASNLSLGKHDALCSCRGTYCAVIYERTNQRLHLVTDKLGLRPIYIWVLPDYIIFATALRILEAISFCKKTMDLQGIAETVCFGYPLSDRTPYENVYSLNAGEIVSCDVGGYQRQRYWRWDDLPASAQSEKEIDSMLPEQLYRVFIDAVRVRLREQKIVAALLSGGLDSRAAVAALKVLGAEVLTANLSMPGSQDYMFGQMAAHRLETHHSQLQFRPLVEGDPYGKAAVRDWLNSPEFFARNLQRPGVVWSGDGGSLGLGHIYLNSDIIHAVREGNLRKATTLFMAYNRWGIHTKLFRQNFASIFASLVDRGIETEIESIHPADGGRIFYLFLLLNDQRRHMFNHFENMDLARIEFEMPFFDSDFIAEVVRHPIDSFLYHNFYLKWLKCFPLQSGVLEVPWQAYPNHVPCPLPQPEGLSYQWDRKISPEQFKERQRASLQKARVLLYESNFSKQYLNYGYMRLFILLTKWGKADRSYLIHAPSVLHRYWSRAH